MLELTGKCCGGIQAIEFMEMLAEVIPEECRTDDFCEEYEEALNRFRYEVAKGIGKKKKITEAFFFLPIVKKGHKDLLKCGHCGSDANEPSWKYCPNCGTRYIK